MTAVLCPTCGRRPVDLTRTEEHILSRLETAPDALGVTEIMKGSYSANSSCRPLITKLQKKLRPFGVVIRNVERRGTGSPARYRLQPIQES